MDTLHLHVLPTKSFSDGEYVVLRMRSEEDATLLRELLSKNWPDPVYIKISTETETQQEDSRIHENE